MGPTALAPSQSLNDSLWKAWDLAQKRWHNTRLLHMRSPTNHKSMGLSSRLLTPKFKGGQVLPLGVEGTVDGQRVLAMTQGLPLV